jgi:hypothetical protein
MFFSLFGILTLTLLGFVSVYAWLEDSNPKYLKWNLVPVLLIAVSVLIPSKDTMYAIAASELGEEVVKSAIGQKSIKALEQWIDSQLEKK